jgi:radical SAM superfamily enzyme YgiQ (UPF0313 family)
VFKVGMGVESGNAGVLARIGKNIDLKKVETANNWFKKEGILTSCFFMIGLPYDTEETVNETIRFAIDLDPDAAVFSVFIPLPDTRAFEELDKAGLICHAMYKEGLTQGFFGKGTYYKNMNMGAETILELHDKAYRAFNLRPRKLLGTICSIRSFSELKWFIEVSLPILKNLVHIH